MLEFGHGVGLGWGVFTKRAKFSASNHIFRSFGRLECVPNQTRDGALPDDNDCLTGGGDGARGGWGRHSSPGF